ncbi:hypothetical protein C8R45DRAFT_906210 [Mycena sanguinolenta]|nr:hypothetical protein C8R45DRAFT_906210 [Mycena sanguinolenta]
MHFGMNWTGLVLELLRATISCEKPDSKDSWDWAVLVGELWKKHGKAVADATPYLPGSFGRPPRNPAEKISSGYKAWEFLLYVVGLLPALLIGVLPHDHWRHLCKGVAVFRCFNQYKIYAEAVVHAHKLAIEYIAEFETLYFQGMPERIHFIRQSVHKFSHLGPEVIRLGPGSLYGQWTMEQTIGNLGREIRSHSQPYANLSQRGLRRSQVNAMYSMYPELDPGKDKPLPRGSIDLGDGVVLLRARDEYRQRLGGEAGRVIRHFMERVQGPTPGTLTVVRWSRLRLPNGQIARSAWKECKRPLNKVRMARNVKIREGEDGKDMIGEVQFYFRAKFDDGTDHAFALVELYSAPCPNLLDLSYGTVWSSYLEPGQHLCVVWVKSILSVVAMVPHELEEELRYFLVEKPGLDLVAWTEYAEEDDEEAPDDNDIIPNE